MNTHLRIARPVSDLQRSLAMYRQGLDLLELGQFADHDGYRLVIERNDWCNS